MERLFEAKKIHVESYGPQSKGWSHIAPGAMQEPTEKTARDRPLLAP